MAVKKSAVKQYLKYILQKTLLPIWYRQGCRGAVRKKTVIFADSNSNTPPESMLPLISELKRRGFNVKIMCRDFSSCGMAAMLSFMRGFMREYARAGAVIVCNYFLPLHACSKRRETFVVQLWHSCGAMKKFGYSTENDISKHFHGSVSKNIDLVTVSSPACVPAFEEAFRLKKGIARAVGVSRTDAFFDEGYKKACYEKLLRLHPEARGKKLILYLPTFRGDAGSAVSVGHQAVSRLRKKLSGEYLVAMRMHPRVKNGICELADMSVNELLICADMLISDYSSAVFEYALLDKPMLLWCPDLEDYLDERDFYLDFKRDMPCPIVTDEGALMQSVLDELHGYKSGGYNEFVKKYMSSCDGHSTERIAELITRKEGKRQ